MEKPPLTQDLSTPGPVPRAWAVWLTNLWVQTNIVSGITADRPTKDLFVGKQYYDTTLNKPIWLRSVRPNIWKDSLGNNV